MLRTVCTCVRRAGRACRARCAAVGRGELRERIRCVTLVLRHSGFTGDNAANQPAGHDSRRTFGRKHPAGSVVLRVLPVPPDLTSGSRSRDQSSKQALHGGAPSPAVADRPGPQNRICAVALLASGPVDRPRRARCDGAVEQRPPACQARQVVHRRTGVAAGPAHGLGARPRSPSAGAGRRPGHGGLRPAGHLRAGAGHGGRGQRELGRAAGRRERQGGVVHPAGHGTGPRAAGRRAAGGGEAGDADAGGYACASPDADSYADAVAGCRACCGGGVRADGSRCAGGCPGLGSGRGGAARRGGGFDSGGSRRADGYGTGGKYGFRQEHDAGRPYGTGKGTSTSTSTGGQHPARARPQHRPGPHHDTCRWYGPRRRQAVGAGHVPRTRRGARLPAEAGRPRLTGLRPGHGEPAVQRVSRGAGSPAAGRRAAAPWAPGQGTRGAADGGMGGVFRATPPGALTPRLRNGVGPGVLARSRRTGEGARGALPPHSEPGKGAGSCTPHQPRPGTPEHSRPAHTSPRRQPRAPHPSHCVATAQNASGRATWRGGRRPAQAPGG